MYDHPSSQLAYHLRKKPNDDIRVVIQIFYESRIHFVRLLIQEYRTYGLSLYFILVWNNPRVLVPKSLRESDDVEIVFSRKNSLNNRWLVDTKGYEGLIFMHDDDLGMSKNAMKLMINAFESNPTGFFSPFVRFLSADGYRTSKFKEGDPYNMGLGILGFHSRFLEDYRILSDEILDFVDFDEGHCDDVLFNIIATKRSKSGVQYVQLPSNSIHDFHKHSYRGAHADSKGISLKKSPLSRKHVRMRCYKTYQHFFGTDILIANNYIPNDFTPHVFAVNTNLTHPCGKMVYGTFFSNQQKIFSKTADKDFISKGYILPFFSSISEDDFILVGREISNWKLSVKDWFNNEYKWKDVYGRNTLLEPRCFLLKKHCFSFAQNEIFLTKIRKVLGSNKPLAIVSMNMFHMDKLSYWQANIDNFNRARGQMVCTYTNIGKEPLHLDIIQESHLYPSIWSLFESELLEHSFSTRLNRDIDVCANQLEIENTKRISLILRSRESILLSNEIWFRFAKTESSLLKSCYAIVKDGENDLFVRSREAKVEYIPCETVPVLTPIAVLEEREGELSLDTKLNFNLNTDVSQYDIESRAISRRWSDTLLYTEETFSLREFHAQDNFIQKVYISNIEGAFMPPMEMFETALLLFSLNGRTRVGLKKEASVHSFSRNFVLTEYSTALVPPNSIETISISENSGLIMLAIEKVQDLRIFQHDPSEKPSLGEALLQSERLQVRMGVCKEKHLNRREKMFVLMLYNEIGSLIEEQNVLKEKYSPVLRVMKEKAFHLDDLVGIRDPFCYSLNEI